MATTRHLDYGTMSQTSVYTRGHASVAVKHDANCLVHNGEGYFNQPEMNDPSSCPLGRRIFEKTVAVDNAARLSNQARLPELRAASQGDVNVFCAHDPDELEQLA